MSDMKVKQQKQIKAFLTEEFGAESGGRLSERQEKIFRLAAENTKENSKSRMKTLVQTILPRIALYKALSESGLPKEEADAYMQKYMQERVAAQKHLSMVRMESVPWFYFIYSRAFLAVTRRSDLWESTQSCGRDCFDVTMKKCLWHTACLENGCAELCRMFCDVDDVTYGGLKKLGFERTTTLGYGGECCDFHFFRKRHGGRG